MNTTIDTVQRFLQYLVQRDLKNLGMLFSKEVDWWIPGDNSKAEWLGRRNTRNEVVEFYELLWKNTEPVSADIDTIFTEGDKAVISGTFVTKMLATGKLVESLFFIQMTVRENEIVKYTLLEDSYAVSVALTP